MTATEDRSRVEPFVLEPPSAAAFAAYAAAVAEGLYPEDFPTEPPCVSRPVAHPGASEIAGVEEVAGADTATPEPRAGRLITVYSPKGGTGTTFFAINLAVTLADAGRRRVCLVDLDLQFGDVAIATGVAPSRGIIDALGLDLPADPDSVEQLLTPVLGGLDGVLAPVDPAAGDALSASLVSTVLQALRERYDYIVVDTSSELSEITLEALDAADHQIIVTTPDLPAIKSTRLLLDTLDRAGFDPSCRAVVLNREDAKVGLQAGRAAEALRHPLAAVLPADPEVGLSIDAGRPLLVDRRADTIRAVLSTFTETCLNVRPVAEDAPRRRFVLNRKRAS